MFVSDVINTANNCITHGPVDQRVDGRNPVTCSKRVVSSIFGHSRGEQKIGVSS